MAAPDPLTMLYNPGRVAVELSGQTFDVTTAWPHGGTGLGEVRDVQWRRVVSYEPLQAEELGGPLPVGQFDTQYKGEAWLLVLTLRGFDSDAISTVFPNTGAGSAGTQRILGTGSTLVAGQLMSSAMAVPLLFTPDDQNHHNAVYLPLAIPEVAEDLEVELHHAAEHLIQVGFRWVPEASNAPQYGLLEDMTTS